MIERLGARGVSAEVVRSSGPAQPGARLLRVLLVDPLTLVREGLRVLLSAQGVEVVGDTATVAEAVGLAPGLHPDVILLDQNLLDQNLAGAAGAIAALKQAAPQARLVVVVTDLDETRIDATLAAGASAHIAKLLPVAKMVDALRAVSRGIRVPAGLFEGERSHRGNGRRIGRRPKRPRTNPLTARQLDILTALGTGERDRAVAIRLGIAEGTVKTHIRHILEVLGVRNRTQAVAYALRKGLIE